MMHYLLVSDLISEAEFEDRMEKKSQEYAGILDEVTIAMMVVDDLGRAHIKIGDIPKAETSIVSFYGKVLSIEGPKEISREGEEEPGAVASLVLGDITGTTKMSLWDDKGKAVLELHEGD
ncbi:MAG TPA: nucleotide-binding protein, partial [Methanocorpusculum sp.]|nr:nucleotide-binding protein [Methanocorpusculum sp.]